MQAEITPNQASNLNANMLDPLIELLNIGGPVVWILLALSVISLSIVLLKCWQYFSAKVEQSAEWEASLSAWEQGRYDEALNTLDNKQAIPKLVLHAMDGHLANEDQNILERELTRQANQIIMDLRGLLKPLEVIATLSPLLGLMGTVLGMIEAFQQMQSAGSNVDPAVLSGGIWQALLTTAAGLAVAIPVAAAYAWFDRRAERVAHHINDSVSRVFTKFSANNTPTNDSPTKMVNETLHVA
ncbi:MULTISPECIES: MotA/TolQ/ExbB proton channel family protein [unclassified Oleiphilus]|nr:MULTISPECIES: MotA/TolQ/ExbB proton channel family protein [unclassified Oleiphilus]